MNTSTESRQYTFHSLNVPMPSEYDLVMLDFNASGPRNTGTLITPRLAGIRDANLEHLLSVFDPCHHVELKKIRKILKNRQSARAHAIRNKLD